MEGCPRKIRSRGLCAFHQRNGEDAVPKHLKRSFTDEQRLLHYRAVTDAGCWEWTASRVRTGYGMAWSNDAQRQILAHRLAYTVWVGPIPAGMEIDHLCNNRACFRPDHLEVVTRQENVRRIRE